MAQPAAGPGTVLAGRYRLGSLLGRGGMGLVWLAHDEVLDRPVAVKEVHTPVHPSEGPEATRERMLREARAAARLHHPGAVRVYDVVDDDLETWLVMEVLSGRTLAETIDAEGPLPEQRVAEIGVALVDTLTAAHAAGILHRDVKPANVQLCDEGRVVLTDFGIAHMSGDASITQTGDIVGSPAFMSPERARGQSLGPPSDLFALAATLYTAVEGHPPFAGETPVATLTAIVGDPPTPYSRARALAPVLDAMLTKDPEQRLDADGARAGLAAVASGDAPVAPAPPAPTPVPAGPTQRVSTVTDAWAVDSTTANDARPLEPTEPRRRVPRGVLAAIAVFLVAALIGAGIAATRRDSDPSGGGGSAADGPFDPGSGGIPANWTPQPSDAGWSIAVPPRWTREEIGEGATRFRRTQDYGYLAILTEHTSESPRRTLEGLETGFASQHADYQRMSLGTTEFRGRPAALWHFTYTDGGAELEASELAYSVRTRSGPTTYVLWWQTKPEEFAATATLRDHLLESFRPAA